MLMLQLKTGEYITIGENVVIQVNEVSSGRCKLMIEAPRDIPIVRGELLERAGQERPECVFETRRRQRTDRLSWNRNKTQALKSMRRLLYKMDSSNPDVKTLRRQLDFLFPPAEDNPEAEPITKVSNG